MSTEKSFAKGSAAPGPVPKDQIRLYSMRFCPFAQRTRLVLHAKGIKFETININLKEKPDWFLQKNPLGLVPVLETPAGEIIYESSITCEYLDEVYPEKKLLPSSPFAKAQQRMMLEHFSKIVPFFYRIPSAKRNGEDVSGMEAEMKEKLGKLNEELVQKKTKFFGGDSITMIDYMMWPHFERTEVYGVMNCLDHTPELKKWMERMLEDPAVKATMFSIEAHRAFYKSFIDGKPDYDYGL
ncbi:glutathione S-transferase omega-1 [Oryzias melastigma]|uniref:Glutathione S-transferase omega n=1 Tax=Oryzias melastigma TaxID=30732 RepID=A0A3B3D701_ORYME|nr:glutathione S-transferase omega-1 [Oryzias melastigma]